MDAVIDHYFLVVEGVGDQVEAVEDRVLDRPAPGDVQDIHRLRRELLDVRRAVWPLREEMSALTRSDSHLIRAETRIFWRDLYDHTVQIIDMVEASRQVIGGAQDTYLSIMGHRMNQIMKVLTVIATIFIPLTFIAGIYGMNFAHMPELEWRFGYPLILAIMLGLGVGMLAWFRHRRWL
jgi:magnesium transporter